MRVSAVVPDVARLPLTVVGGDTGAGKTTLLGQLQGQEHVGDVAIVRDALAGDLSAELAELRPRLDQSAHVLIEARADSSLRRIAGYGYMPGYRLDGIIVVMNVQDIHERQADAELRARMTTQLRNADILIVNKLDLVEPAKRALHHEWLDAELPRLRVIETSQGRVAGSLLLGVSAEVARRDARTVPANWETTYLAPRRAHLHSATETAEPHYRVWSIETARPIGAQRFRTWVSLLPRTVVRGDGDVFIEEDPQHRYQFHMIGLRWQLQRERPWDSAPETQLTLVGM
jgi:G3E family GTPase